MYNQNPAILQSNVEFYLYDHSNLNATWQTAMNLLNFHIYPSTPLPTSPPNEQFQSYPNSQPPLIGESEEPGLAWTGESGLLILLILLILLSEEVVG